MVKWDTLDQSFGLSSVFWKWICSENFRITKEKVILILENHTTFNCVIQHLFFLSICDLRWAESSFVWVFFSDKYSIIRNSCTHIIKAAAYLGCYINCKEKKINQIGITFFVLFLVHLYILFSSFFTLWLQLFLLQAWTFQSKITHYGMLQFQAVSQTKFGYLYQAVILNQYFFVCLFFVGGGVCS